MLNYSSDKIYASTVGRSGEGGTRACFREPGTELRLLIGGKNKEEWAQINRWDEQK